MESNNNIKFLTIILVVLCIVLYYSRKPATKNGPVFINNIKEKREYARNYDLCLKKYQDRQFEESADCFKKLRDIKDEYETKYMYAISMGFAKNFSEAVELLDEIIKDETIKDEDLKDKAREGYAEFLKHKRASESFSRTDIGNYMGDIQNITKWRNPNSLKVYIYDDYDKKSAIKKAFKKWDDELRSTVDFVYVNDPQSADITAKAVNISELPGDRIGDTQIEALYYLRNPRKKYMLKADIRVSYNKMNNTHWSDEEFQSILLHEIGHALGISDHSRNRGDIMYYDSSTYRKATVSNRDVNTVKAIYGSII